MNSDIATALPPESALRLDAEKFRQLSEKSFIGIYIIQDTKVVYINPRLAEMFGFAPEEIIGRPMPKDLIHPDDLQTALSRIQQRLDGLGEKNSISFKTFKKDGSTIHIEIYGTLIEYQGRPAAMGTIMDVTERKQAEQALRASEERLREVMENSLDAAYKRNLQTNSYDYFSPIITRLSGYTPDEMVTLPLESVLELIHPEDLPEVNRRMAEALSGTPGAAWQVEYRFKHKHGQYCWFQDRFTVMRDSGCQPLAQIGSMSDISERRQAQSLQEAVYQIAAAAETAGSLDELYPKIHQSVASVMPAENFYIALYDEAQNLLRFPYYQDIVDTPFATDIQPGQGLTAYVLRAGKSLLGTLAKRQ